MYAIAANPDRWEEVIDALGEAPPAPDSVDDVAAGLVRAAANPASAVGPQVGLVVLSPAGAVLGCNSAGEALFQRRLGHIEAHGLRFFEPSNHEALDQARRRLRDSASRQVIVKFAQADDEGPHFAYVTPAEGLPPALAASLPDASVLGAGVIAILFPAVEATDRLWASLRESFGLTPAETRLAAKLKDGLTLRETADALGVSVNTVRNQLRAVFDKMGLNRQSDLVRALTQLGSLAGALPNDAGPRSFGPAILATERGAAEAAPPLRFVSLADGRRIAYRDYGAPLGRPAMVVHQGLGSSLLPRGSDSLARDLGLRLICPERPGCGRSDPNPDFSYEGVGRDLAEVSRRLGLADLQIAGFMSGAAFALCVAHALGDEVRRVLIASARPPGSKRESERDARHRLVLFRRRLLQSAWLADTVFAVLRLQMTPAHIARIVRTGASAPGDAAYLAAHPGVVDFITEYIRESLAVSARGIAAEVRCAAQDPPFRIPHLSAPVTLWQGGDDPLASAEDAAAWLAELSPEVRLIEGVGHFLPHKHWPEVLGWLAEG